MKYKITQFLLLVTILIIVASCKDNNPVLPDYKRSQSDVIKPLAIGNYWKYKVTYYDDVNFPAEYSIEKILEDTTINDLKYFIIKNDQALNIPFFMASDMDPFSWNTRNFYCINKSSGFQKNAKIKYEEFIKYPAKVGEEFSLINTDKFIAKVISTNEIITVLAGTFSCYHYQAQDSAYRIVSNGQAVGTQTYRIDLYYAVGVGLILEKWNPIDNVNPMPFIHKELMEYEVK